MALSIRPGARALLILLAFAALSAPLTRIGAPDTRAQDEIAALPETPGIVVLGDSRPHYGLSPTILASALAKGGLSGVTARSFAEDGTDMLHHHNLFATALVTRRPPPKVVVLATDPLSFDETRKNNRLDRIDPRDLPRMARAGAPLETLLDLGTMAIFPPYRSRPGTKEELELFTEKAAFAFAGKQSRVGLHFRVPPERRTYTPHPDGQRSFVVFRDWEFGFELSRGGYRDRYERFVLGDFHVRLLRDVARLARERGVLLVILEMPVAPAYQSDFATREPHLRWRGEVARIAGEEGAEWICHAAMYGDDRGFGDPGHMQEPLAARYSEDLASALLANERVAAALRAPR